MTSPTNRRSEELLALEGLRAISAVCVVAFHLWQHGITYPQGRVITPFNIDGVFYAMTSAVAIFFVLSGFLLARPFLRRALQGAGLPNMREWTRRRAARLLPLYATLTVSIWSARNYSWPGDWRDLLEHLTFTQDLDGRRIFYTLGPAWSLASEVKFYLLLAALAWFWVRTTSPLTSGRLRVLVLALPIAALWTFSMAFKWVVFEQQHISANAYQWSFSFPARLDAFCIGMSLALWAAWREVNDRPEWRPRSMAWGLVLLAGLAYGGHARAIGVEKTQVWLYPLYALVCAPFVMALASCPRGRVVRALSWPPLVRLGVLTFSLYLVHEPVMEYCSFLTGSELGYFWQLPVFFVLAFGAAWLVHTTIERPGLQLLQLWDRDGRREYYPHLVSQAPTPRLVTRLPVRTPARM